MDGNVSTNTSQNIHRGTSPRRTTMRLQVQHNQGAGEQAQPSVSSDLRPRGARTNRVPEFSSQKFSRPQQVPTPPLEPIKSSQRFRNEARLSGWPDQHTGLVPKRHTVEKCQQRWCGTYTLCRCKYVVLGNRNMKAAFLCKFPPDAELATMQDGNLQGTRLLMA